MSLWKNWVKNKTFIENTDDFAIDYEKVQSNLFKVIMEKYPEETMKFLEDISERGDEEVKNLLTQIKRTSSSSNEKDEVMPNLADSGFSSID